MKSVAFIGSVVNTMQLDTNNHSVFVLHYHLIMCIKYRNKVIDDTISNRLREIFVRIAPSYPKFKSAKHSRKAYTTNNQKGTAAIIDNRYIRLPKIGRVKAVIHRIPKSDWIVKSAAVSQESDGKYYISILFTFDNAVNDYKADKMKAVGLDYASDGLYVDNNGNVGTNHKYYRESHNKLAKAQRKLSRIQDSKKHEVKSNNYIKQLHKVNKIHRHIANQRLDNLYKISAEIANQYDVVCVESLNMRSMANCGFGNGKVTLYIYIC